jgi:aquaporin related protein
MNQCTNGKRSLQEESLNIQIRRSILLLQYPLPCTTFHFRQYRSRIRRPLHHIPTSRHVQPLLNMNVDRPARGLRVPWKSRLSQLPHHHEHHVARHLPFPFTRLSKNVKGHVVACVGELVGTFMFLLFALGGTNVVNTAPKSGANAVDLSANPSKIMYISLVFGLALTVNAWVFFRISGGLFNPAVTLGMMVVGATGYVRGMLIIVSQIIGGIAAAGVVSAMMPNVLAVRTELGGGTTVVQGLFIEVY